MRCISCLPIAAVFLVGAAVAAAPGSRFSVARTDLAGFLREAQRRFGPLRTLQGELTTAGSGKCILRKGDRDYAFHPVSHSRICVNGWPAPLESARPVGQGQYFWARLWYARQREIVALEAVYYGGELVVSSAAADALTGFSPELGITLRLPMAATYRGRLPRPGQAIYVLLDLQGKVRYIHVLAFSTRREAGEVPLSVE